MIGWDRRNVAGSHQARSAGIGVASELHSATAYPETREIANAAVAINEDGTVQLRIGSADLGTGAKTVIAQIAAETLGVCYEDIPVVAGDTDLVPYDLGAYASRTTYIAGGAVQRAAASGEGATPALAAAKLGVAPEELDVEQRRDPRQGRSPTPIYLPRGGAPGRGRARPVIMGQARLCRRATTTPSRPSSPRSRWTPRPARCGSCAWWRSTTSARPSTRPVPRARSRAACTRASATRLIEDMVIDPRTGRTLNPNFVDYKLLTAQDMPEMEVEFVESADPAGAVSAPRACGGRRVPDRPGASSTRSTMPPESGSRNCPRLPSSCLLR